MDHVHFDLAKSRLSEAMAVAARERQATAVAPRSSVLARLRALLTSR